MAELKATDVLVVVKGDAPLVDRYILKPEGYAEETFEGDRAHVVALERQSELQKKGISSQLFHERLVLLREPINWVVGWEKPDAPNTNGIILGS